MSPEWGKYDQAKADADIAVHAALATGIHGVGSGTVVGTGLTQTLTDKTLTSPVIQGTVSAGTGLTMPAFTAGGDINIGAHGLKTTNYQLKEENTYAGVSIETLAGSFANLGVKALYINDSVQSNIDGCAWSARGVADNYVLLQAMDTGVGLIEIARLQGAADPYMSFGGSQQHKFTNAGLIFFTGLPTSNPGVAGQLYTAAGVLMVSAG